MVAARAALIEGKPRGVFTRDDIRGDTVLDCDVVIVGSGAGGAPMAAELAEAGFDVLVVEEGRYYQTRDFTADTSAMVRQLYRDGGGTMALGNPPVMFQEGRLKIARKLGFGETLVEELQSMQVRVTPSGREQYASWREGSHDDLVFAVALACWSAKETFPGRREQEYWLDRLAADRAEVFRKVMKERE